jgi:zinc/manganese transport system substrate-binding protein
MNMLKRSFPNVRATAAAAVAAFALSLSACSVPAATPAGGAAVNGQAAGKLRVIATFSVLGDIVKNVGGDKIDLKVLVGPDADAHDFDPAPSDAKEVGAAQVIVENGVEFEAWMDALYATSQSKAVRVVAADSVELRDAAEAAHGDERAGEKPGEGANESNATKEAQAGASAKPDEHNGEAKDAREEHDPHVWQDVRNVIKIVGTVEAALSKADAPNAAAYKANAAAYIAKLEALDKEIVDAFAAVPQDRRKMVTSHDALAYFGARYGVEIVGSVIASLSTESGEPSAQDFAKLVDTIKQENARAIFVENIGNANLVERVAGETGLVLGEALYTDALGLPGTPGADYIGMMRHNARAISQALSGAK